jgi:putative FmdB family regulatory protein
MASAKAREDHVPTYQYACTECGHRLEAVQSFTDEPLSECPECAGKLRKVFSSVGVVFKGSGFYRNDSRNAAKSETKAESKAETKAETKSESKSETTAKTDSAPKTETKKADTKPAATTAAA